MKGNIKGARLEKVVTKEESALLNPLKMELTEGNYEIGGYNSDQTENIIRQNFPAN